MTELARLIGILNGSILLAMAAMVFAGGVAADDETEIVVVYPKVREPFAALYRDYLVGISETVPGKITEYAINGESQASLAKAVDLSPPDVFMAIGNKSVKIADQVRGGKPLVAVVANRQYESVLSGGILLKPSADVYMANLLDIYDKIHKIYVVYSPEYDQDLVNDAKTIAERRGIVFTAVKATDIREAAAGYQKFLQEAKAYSAIWLLPDNGFLDSSLLSTILDVAWEKKLIVFSSNPLFVKHGALFAVYPDNRGVGVTLGEIALSVENGEKLPLQPLRDVRLAVNERTINHLGIDLSPEVRRRIELMLPGR